jgi:hypothetical protein
MPTYDQSGQELQELDEVVVTAPRPVPRVNNQLLWVLAGLAAAAYFVIEGSKPPARRRRLR